MTSAQLVRPAIDLSIPAERPRILRDPLLSLAVLVIALLILFAVFGPLIAPYSPDATDILGANAPPSSVHWFGTDALGRDLFARAAYGARLSLLGPALVVTASTAVATALAICAAWFGGWVDTVIGRFMDILFAFPTLLFAVLAISFFGVGLIAPVVALSIAYIPYIGRVARVVAVRERSQPYIDACLLAGFSAPRIALRHMIPGLVPVLRAQATITFAYALADLAAISFIGLGVQAPTAEWGVMVASGSSALLNGYPEEVLVAGLLIVITVVSFNLLGERLARSAENK